MINKLKKDIQLNIRNRFVVTILRTLLAEIKNQQIKLKRDLTDQEFYAQVKRLVKQYNEMASDFLKAERQDEQLLILQKVEILEKYLPQYLNEVKTKKVVLDIIKLLNASSKRDMGKVMGKLRTRTNIDMKLASKVVLQCLS